MLVPTQTSTTELASFFDSIKPIAEYKVMLPPTLCSCLLEEYFWSLFSGSYIAPWPSLASAQHHTFFLRIAGPMILVVLLTSQKSKNTYSAINGIREVQMEEIVLGEWLGVVIWSLGGIVRLPFKMGQSTIDSVSFLDQ